MTQGNIVWTYSTTGGDKYAVISTQTSACVIIKIK